MYEWKHLESNLGTGGTCSSTSGGCLGKYQCMPPPFSVLPWVLTFVTARDGILGWMGLDLVQSISSGALQHRKIWRWPCVPTCYMLLCSYMGNAAKWSSFVSTMVWTCVHIPDWGAEGCSPIPGARADGNQWIWQPDPHPTPYRKDF